MKVLFIYTDVSSAVGFSSGIGVLSALLKREGHETKLIHVSNELDYPLDVERINRDIADYSPGLICFSVTTNQWYFTGQIGKEIKRKFEIPIVVGGPHATAAPDDAIAEPWVDVVCRGEGDRALTDLVRQIASGLPFAGIPNLSHKKNGNVIREPLGPWVDNLDTLPFEDRKIFNYSRIVDTRDGWAEVIVTRGCPYACTYCFNQPSFDKYKKYLKANTGTSVTKRDYTRRRSVDSTIRMLKELKMTYPNITGFTFVDDILAIDGEWFEEFARRYSKEIELPYACTSHPLLFDEKVAKLLKDSGCKVVKMGVESGNPEIRKRVLKRNISNEHLVEVFELAKKFGLKPQAFNMIGLPGETFENMMETVQLNAQMKPYIVWLSTFIPYPGTALYKLCREKGMIDEAKWNQADSYRGESVLKDEYLPPLKFKKIRVMYRWFLNANLNNDVRGIYRDHIRELDSLPDDQWHDGCVERLFKEREAQIDQDLRKKDIGHYVGKKYIHIYFGKEYHYDLT